MTTTATDRDAFGRCVACGDPDSLDTGVCGRCAAVAPRRGDLLVLCARPRTPSDLAEARQRLSDVFGDVTRSAAGRSAAAGRRPVMRLSASVAPRFVTAMDARGLATRTLPVGRALTLMPFHFFVLIAAITVLGAVTGALVVPMFRWLSPALAMALVVSAHTGSTTPLFTPKKLRGGAARTRVAVDALGRLSPGRARTLLADLLALAQPLLDRDPRADLPRLTGDLLAAASATALEVDRLERIRVTLERHQLDGPTAFDVRAATATCGRALRMGTDRLEAAIAVLGQLGTATMDHARVSGERVAQLTRALEIEARAQGDAAREVEQLLRA
jgi:hypothetical protein